MGTALEYAGCYARRDVRVYRASREWRNGKEGLKDFEFAIWDLECRARRLKADSLRQ